MNPETVTLTWEEFATLTTAIIAMSSAYEVHASRSRHVGRAVADAFYSTRMADFRKAAEMALEISRRESCPSS